MEGERVVGSEGGREEGDGDEGWQEMDGRSKTRAEEVEVLMGGWVSQAWWCGALERSSLSSGA